MRRFLLVGLGVGLVLLLAAFFSNTFLRFAFPEKVWLHRANSIERLTNTAAFYTGVEVDVVFDHSADCFDIHHPPAPKSGLTLEQYFQSITSHKKHFWIDLKNLSESNVSKALERLIRVSNSCGVPISSIIVEANNTCLLIPFTEAGFKTSFYLPSGMNVQNDLKLKETVAYVNKQWKKCPTDFISSEFKDYDIIRTYFPKQKKLFWFTVYAGTNKWKARLMLLNLLMDDSVEVLLVSD